MPFRRNLRNVLAITAAVTCVVTVASLLSFESVRTNSVKVPVAARDAMCGEGEHEIIHVSTTGLEWNGVPTTTRKLEQELPGRLANRASRAAYIEGETGTPFGDVAKVINLLKALNVQVVMLTPSVKAHDCSSTVTPTRPVPQIAKDVNAIPWWKFW